MYGKRDHLEAIWCIDSETGREFLVDLKTNKILAERKDGKLVEYIDLDTSLNEGC